MRLDLVTDQRVEVVLSRRNLLTLLAKLDGFPPNSSCYLAFFDYEIPALFVRAESDAEHYGRRDTPPGPMHPATEERIRQGAPPA